MKPRKQGNKAAPRRDKKAALRALRRNVERHFRTKARKAITGMLARAVARHRRIRETYAGSFRHDGYPEWQRLMDWQREWEDYLRNERSKLYGKTSGTHSVSRP